MTWPASRPIWLAFIKVVVVVLLADLLSWFEVNEISLLSTSVIPDARLLTRAGSE